MDLPDALLAEIQGALREDQSHRCPDLAEMSSGLVLTITVARRARPYPARWLPSKNPEGEGSQVRLALVLALVVALGMGGCAARVQPVSPGDTVHLVVGQTCRLALESNPSTGYSWSVEFDGSGVQLVRQDCESRSKLVGAPGEEVFIFRATEKGDSPGGPPLPAALGGRGDPDRGRVLCRSLTRFRSARKWCEAPKNNRAADHKPMARRDS